MPSYDTPSINIMLLQHLPDSQQGYIDLGCIYGITATFQEKKVSDRYQHLVTFCFDQNNSH